MTKWASQPSETVGCSEQSLGLWEVPQLAGGKGTTLAVANTFTWLLPKKGLVPKSEYDELDDRFKEFMQNLKITKREVVKLCRKSSTDFPWIVAIPAYCCE